MIKSSILPDPQINLLLKASLLERSMVEESWGQFLEQVKDFPDYVKRSPRIKRILPLLYRSLKLKNIPKNKRDSLILKTSYLSECTRYDHYIVACKEVFSLLSENQISFIIPKGLAVAHLAYPDAKLRHCHDLDILIRKEDMFKVSAIMKSKNMTEKYLDFPIQPNLRFIHSSRFPIEFHNTLFKGKYYEILDKSVFTQSQSITIGESTVKTVSTEMMLIQICTHAPQCQWSVVWICDLFYLLKKTDINWKTLIELTLESKTIIPVFTALNYLKKNLQVKIPEQCHIQLEEKYLNADKRQKDIWIFSQQPAPSAKVKNYLRAEKESKVLIRQFIFPNLGYISFLSKQSALPYPAYTICFWVRFLYSRSINLLKYAIRLGCR